MLDKYCCLIANQTAFEMRKQTYMFLDFEMKVLSLKGYNSFVMIYNNFFDIEVLKILNNIREIGISNLSIELVIINSYALNKISKRKNRVFETAKALCDNIKIISNEHSPQNTALLCAYLAENSDLLFYIGNGYRLRYGCLEGRILKSFIKHERKIILADPSNNFEEPKTFKIIDSKKIRTGL